MTTGIEFACVVALIVFPLVLVNLLLHSPRTMACVALGLAVAVGIGIWMASSTTGSSTARVIGQPLVLIPAFAGLMACVAIVGIMQSRRSRDRWMQEMWSLPTPEPEFGRYCVALLRSQQWKIVRVDYHPVFTMAVVSKDGLFATVAFLSQARSPSYVLSRLSAMKFPRVGRLVLVTRALPLSIYTEEAIAVNVSVLYGRKLDLLLELCRQPIATAV